MTTRPIEFGVVVNHLRLSVKEGLRLAAQMGFHTIELSATGPQINPQDLSRTGQRHLLRYVRDLGLRLVALGGDVGARGLAEPSAVEQRVDTIKRILELAARLGVAIVTTRTGCVADDSPAMQRDPIIEAVEQLGKHADVTGTTLAVRTGTESPQELRCFLELIDCSQVGVCYDPGALLMHGYEPIHGVTHLAEHIVVSHARDATAGRADRAGREMPAGQGELDFTEYLAALDEAGYRGPQIVARSESDRPIADIAAAKVHLDALLR